MSKLFFRAAGWVSADREVHFRLTNESQAMLPDDELIKIATSAATERQLAEKFGEGGSIEVGQWGAAFIHVKHPAFDPGQSDVFDDVDVAEASEQALQFAAYYPYDQRMPKDLAHWAAQGILADLEGRGGLDHLLGELGDEVRQQIVSVAAAIVRRAMTTNI